MFQIISTVPRRGCGVNSPPSKTFVCIWCFLSDCVRLVIPHVVRPFVYHYVIVYLYCLGSEVEAVEGEAARPPFPRHAGLFLLISKLLFFII